VPPPIERALECEPDFGTRALILPQRLAPDGDWIIACSAAEDTDGRDGVSATLEHHHGRPVGDELYPFFIRQGETDGMRIDAYLSSDALGRRVAVIRDGRVILIDTDTLSEQVIPARVAIDPVLDAYVDLDATGGCIRYTRWEEGREVLLERTLGDGAEHVIDVGPGRILEIHDFAGGLFFRVGVATPMSDVAFARSVAPDPRVRVACPPFELQRRSVRMPPGYVMEWRTFRSRDGTRVMADVFAAGDDSLLVRDANGTIRIEDASGVPSVVVPRTCDARIRGFWPEGQAILVECAEGRYTRLRVYDEEGDHDLGVFGALTPRDDIPVGPVVQLERESNTMVDIARRRIVPPATDARAIHIRGAFVLEHLAGVAMQVRDFEHDTLRSLDAPGSGPTTFGGMSSRFVELYRDGRLTLYDAEARVLLGTMPFGTPFYTVDGRGLVHRDRRAGLGPLCLLRPEQ
jgi:hypothetical protein